MLTCRRNTCVRLIISVMNTFLDTSVVNEAMVETCDTKLAVWSSLLPACKKDPLRHDGRVDEVMYVCTDKH